MKNLFLTVLTIFTFIITTYAQEPKPKFNLLKYGYGTTFHQDQLVGTFQYGEYSRFFGDRVSLGLHGGVLNASKKRGTVDEQTLKTLDGGLMLNFSAVSSPKNHLKIGGGGTYRYGDLTTKDSLKTEIQTYGWNVNLEYEVYVVNTLVIGSRASYTQFENGQSNYFFGLNAGFKF